MDPGDGKPASAGYAAAVRNLLAKNTPRRTLSSPNSPVARARSSSRAAQLPPLFIEPLADPEAVDAATADARNSPRTGSPRHSPRLARLSAPPNSIAPLPPHVGAQASKSSPLAGSGDTSTPDSPLARRRRDLTPNPVRRLSPGQVLIKQQSIQRSGELAVVTPTSPAGSPSISKRKLTTATSKDSSPSRMQSSADVLPMQNLDLDI